MYSKSAKYYDAIYHFIDYKSAAEKLMRLIRETRPDARTLLDVGCGTARHCAYLAKELETVEGLDISPELLQVARERLPGCTFHQGNMIEFALGKRFDVVTCLFSVIGAAETLDGMRATVQRLAAHLEPGGLLVVEPWFFPESYWTGHVTANHVDEKDLKISWMYIAKKEGLVSVLDIHYLVGTPETIENFTEQHRLGLFTHEQYLDAFARAGLDVTHDPDGLVGRGMYVARAR